MRRVAGGLIWLVLVAAARAGGMQATAAPAAQEPGLAVHGGAERPPLSEKQKALLADTERLMKMAAELKVSVDKSTKNELSLDVVRKAEAIEKLARSVKERIREAH